MQKSTRKKARQAKQTKKAKKSKKAGKSRTKAAEYVSCLLELHKLQGGLLNQLNKEVQ